MKRNLLLQVLAGIALLAGIGLIFIDFPGVFAGQSDDSLDGEQLLRAPEIGALAPDFELLTITGESIRLDDLRGQVVLLNFWATWCAPCRLEMPHLQNRFELFSPDLVVLAVNFDEPAQDVGAFVLELGLTFPTLLDPGALVQDLYRVRGYPTSVFVDRDGVIQIIHIGILTEGQLDDYLAQVGIGP